MTMHTRHTWWYLFGLLLIPLLGLIFTAGSVSATPDTPTGPGNPLGAPPPPVATSTATPTCTAGSGLLIVSGMTTGWPYHSWTTTLASNTVSYAWANSLFALNAFAIFQAEDPWNHTAIKDAITAAGHTYSVFTPGQLVGFDFSRWRVVVLNWDDQSQNQFDPPYSSVIPQLEAYVQGGGVLWLEGAMYGGGGTTYPLPFGGTAAYDFTTGDPIVDTAHPLAAGMPNPVTDYPSYVSFSGWPENAHTIIASGNNQHATLYVYQPNGPCRTPTATGTPPTATGTPTSTLTPTAMPTVCGNVILNGGFETGSFSPWVILGVNPTPVVTIASHHSGSSSALLGTVSGYEPYGDSSIYQQFTVPADGGMLSYWWNGDSYGDIDFDYQDAYITDTSGNTLATIMHNRETTGGWISQTFDMSPFAGQTVRLEFLVYEDNFGDNTYMYVDDVQLLNTCATGTPTIPITNTPSPPPATATGTATPSATSAATPGPSVTPLLSPSITPSMPPTYTPTSIPALTATSTTIATATAPVTSTSTALPQPSGTPTPCSLSFTDVPVSSTFYPYIHCLACRGIINGYPDGTFKPNANVTRGQLSKIVSNAAGFNDNQTTRTFQDVPVGSTFFQYIGRLASRGFIGGYACGGTGEPCVPPTNLPYFRPNNNATRGQISKIVSNAARFNDTPNGQQFEDVPVGSTYYTYTYRLVTRNIMHGYACGGTGEPCIPPANLPYFRPNNNATRGQTSKIVGNTFFPNCQTPAER